MVGIGGVSISDGNTLKQMAVDERRQKIVKEIARLEKQPKKFELMRQIKSSKKNWRDKFGSKID